MSDEKCVWSQEEEDGQDWHSSCGTSFMFNDGAPSDNSFSFCPNCGKTLEESIHPDSDQAN